MKKNFSVLVLMFIGSTILLSFQNCGKVKFDRGQEELPLCLSNALEIIASPESNSYALNTNVRLSVSNLSASDRDDGPLVYNWEVVKTFSNGNSQAAQVQTFTTEEIQINTGADFGAVFAVTVSVRTGDDCAARVASRNLVVTDNQCNSEDISEINGLSRLSVNQQSPYSFASGDCNPVTNTWQSNIVVDPLSVGVPANGNHQIVTTADPKRINLRYLYAGKYNLSTRVRNTTGLDVTRNKEIIVEAACTFGGQNILFGQPLRRLFKRSSTCGQCEGVEVSCNNQAQLILTPLNNQTVLPTDTSYTYSDQAACVAANACPPPNGCSDTTIDGVRVTAPHNGTVTVYQRATGRTCSHNCSPVTLTCNNGSFRLNGVGVSLSTSYYANLQGQNSCVQTCTQCTYREAGGTTNVRVNISPNPIVRYRAAATCGSCEAEQFLCDQARANLEGGGAPPFQFRPGFTHTTRDQCNQANACPVCPQNLPLHSATGAVVAAGGYASSMVNGICQCNNGLRTKRTDDANADGIRDGTTNTPATGTPTACVQACTPGAGPTPDDLPTIDASTGQYGCYGCKRYTVEYNQADGLYFQGKCHYCLNGGYGSSRWTRTLNTSGTYESPASLGQTYREVNGYYCQDTSCYSTGLNENTGAEYRASMGKLDLNLYNCTTETTSCPGDWDGDGQDDPLENNTMTYTRRYPGGSVVSDYANYACTSQGQTWLYRLTCNQVTPTNTIHLYRCERSALCVLSNCNPTYGGGGPGNGFPGGGGVWGP